MAFAAEFVECNSWAGLGGCPTPDDDAKLLSIANSDDPATIAGSELVGKSESNLLAAEHELGDCTSLAGLDRRPTHDNDSKSLSPANPDDLATSLEGEPVDK